MRAEEGGRHEVSPRRLRTCGELRGWRSGDPPSPISRAAPGAYLFFHARVPGVSASFPGTRHVAPGPFVPSYSVVFGTGDNCLVPAHRGGLLTSWSHLVRSPCCASNPYGKQPQRFLSLTGSLKRVCSTCTSPRVVPCLFCDVRDSFLSKILCMLFFKVEMVSTF